MLSGPQPKPYSNPSHDHLFASRSLLSVFCYPSTHRCFFTPLLLRFLNSSLPLYRVTSSLPYLSSCSYPPSSLSSASSCSTSPPPQSTSSVPASSHPPPSAPSHAARSSPSPPAILSDRAAPRRAKK